MSDCPEHPGVAQQAAEAVLHRLVDERDRLRAALAEHAVVAEYDCPGDTPEFCGMSCQLCFGLDRHEPDCLLAEISVPPARRLRARGLYAATRGAGRRRGPLIHSAKWTGTAAGVAGAVIIAANLGAVSVGFVLFLVSSILWAIVGWAQREPSLIVLQAAFTVINLLGIWRWSGV